MHVVCRDADRYGLRVVEDLLVFQFGPYGAKALDRFDKSKIKLCYSPTTKRLRGIAYGDRIIATVRASDFMLIPHIALGYALHKVLPYPTARIVVVNEIARDVFEEGRTVFSKHVIGGDEAIRAYDEVLVVDEDDELIAVGRALLDYETIITATYGGAVQIREKVDRYEKS